MNDDDIFCPHCKTSKYRNPSLKLYVNTCGHPLCENCLDLVFLKDSGKCTQCGITLRRNNFRLKLFEDDLVEKEIDIRRKILKDYNKKEDDFDTLAEYDNYLEEIETIIFNLTNNIDIEETKKQIEEYRKQNAGLITKNRNKLSTDELLIEQLLEEEKEREKLRKKWQIVDETNEQFSKMKKLQKEALVDELMNSNLSATQILELHVNDLKLKEQQKKQIDDEQQNEFKKKTEIESISRSKPNFFSTGIQLGKAANIFKPIVKDESKPYAYKTKNLNINGPKLPTKITDNYLRNVVGSRVEELAGGFDPSYSCSRALLDAFNGLYFKCSN